MDASIPPAHVWPLLGRPCWHFSRALDALVMSAAMPTIVADLGGLQLYSWVYSAYFLARAVSLPIFGKLADLYKNRRLFIGAIVLFSLSSRPPDAP